MHLHIQIGMRLREKKALLRLQKISEGSSPSPTRQPKTEQTYNNRFNPLVLAKGIVNKQPLSPPLDLSTRLKYLHETIMDKKARNTLWEDAQIRRDLPLKHHGSVFGNIIKGILLLGRGQPNFASSALKAMTKGRKGILQWMLCWLRQLFWLISVLLTNHQIAKH